MAKSVRIQGIGGNRRTTRLSPQWWGIETSQFALTGEHMKAKANVDEIHQHTTIPASTLTVIWKLRVMNMR